MKHHRTRVLIIQPAMPLLYSPASSHPPCSPSSPLPPPPFRRSLPDSEPACSPHCLACGPWRRVRSRRRRQRWTRWKEPPLLSTPSRCDWAICMQLSSALTGASLCTLFVPPRLTSDTGEQSHLPSQADFPPSIFPAPPPPFSQVIQAMQVLRVTGPHIVPELVPDLASLLPQLCTCSR